MWVLRGGPQLVKKLATFWGYHERKIEKKYRLCLFAEK